MSNRGLYASSIPLAFVSSALASLCWLGNVPYQVLYLNRRKPVRADEELR